MSRVRLGLLHHIHIFLTVVPHIHNNRTAIDKLFNHEYKLIPERPGDRHESLVNLKETYKKLKWKPKYKLEKWIKTIQK